MQPVANTPEILYYKVTNKGVDDVWVQWAIDMLEAGFDTEHLRILAGELKPFNQWYLGPLTDKVLKELGISTTDVTTITNTYICFLIDCAFTGKENYKNILDKLRQLYDEEPEGFELADFYCLYYAMQDLKVDTVAYDWPGATRENIKDIVYRHFDKWRHAHCVNTSKNKY